MDFREGGTWLYSRVGPEGEEHFARADYLKIVPQKSFVAIDSFADEDGNISDILTPTEWHVSFSRSGDLTLATFILKFTDLENLEKMIEMGFKEGFIMALGNLDELLNTM
jgi:uncharacterized protein YndB with AHSA1/START domain